MMFLWPRETLVKVTQAAILLFFALAFAATRLLRAGDLDESGVAGGVGDGSGGAASAYPVVQGEVKFLTFEPWNGGWNNRRMSLEIALLLAMATNRTLVLPPVSRVALMTTPSGYEEFFDLPAMRDILPILTWDEFQPLIPRVRPSPNRAKTPITCAYKMPNPRTFCTTNLRVRQISRLNSWVFLKSVLTMPLDARLTLEQRKDLDQFGPNRVLVNDDMRDAASETIWHFPQNLFGHFYQLVYFTDPALRRSLFSKIRDATRIRSDIQAYADEVVKQLGGPNSFYSVHIRRRDFKQQYKSTFIEPRAMAANIKNQLGRVVYIASDEGNKEFWADLKAGLPDVSTFRFASSFESVFKNVPDTQKGVVEQLICAQAKVFIGTRFSTFSSYIVRLRGYDPAVLNKEVYFTDTKLEARHPIAEHAKPYSWVKNPLWSRAPWAREFPEAWEDLL
ncbi:GDP-fucose protein O-fucosyltransferase 2 [Diplonema papillatum]|nr:GDP-fucose protein O-fucosyltransferase 2 [Diplonema papillatum]